MTDRRTLLTGATLVALLGGTSSAAPTPAGAWGSLGRIRARPGSGAALAALIAGASSRMPGCLLYTVSHEAADPDALWVFEAWQGKDAHDRSLSLPGVREAIGKARPLIAGMDSDAELTLLSIEMGTK